MVAVGLPVRAGLAKGANNASAVVALVVSTPTAEVVNAVVATCVVLVNAAAVGAAGMPVNVGLAIGASRA